MLFRSDFDAMIANYLPSTRLPSAVAWGWEGVEQADAAAGLPAALVQPWMAARRAARAGDPFTVPEGLPEEYRLYLLGSAAYGKDRCADTSAFQALLALPPEQRRNRTTWAEYTLATCAFPEEAIHRLEQVRAEALDGFADRWGLAASSYGEQARFYQRTPEAFRLYAAQAASDPSGRTSLLVHAREALDAPESLPRLAADPLASTVISAYVLSRAAPDAVTAPSDTYLETFSSRHNADEDDARRLR